MSYKMLKESACYFGAIVSFAALLGISAYTRDYCKRASVDRMAEAIALAIPAVPLVPLGIYFIAKGNKYKKEDYEEKKALENMLEKDE